MIAKLIEWFHDIIAIIHCIIIGWMSLCLLPTYIYDPLGNLPIEMFEYMKYNLFTSIAYFIFGTYVLLFFEEFNKKTIQYLFHHILTLSVPIVLIITEQYSNIVASFYLAEISTAILSLRSLGRRIGIRSSIMIIIDVLFAISFVLSRFTVLFYMCCVFLLGYQDHYQNWTYIFLVLIIILGNLLNLVWLKEIIGMIRKKIGAKKIIVSDNSNSNITSNSDSMTTNHVDTNNESLVPNVNHNNDNLDKIE